MPMSNLSSALFARLTAAVNSLLLLMILLFEIICAFAVLCWSAKWLFFWGKRWILGGLFMGFNCRYKVPREVFFPSPPHSTQKRLMPRPHEKRRTIYIINKFWNPRGNIAIPLIRVACCLFLHTWTVTPTNSFSAASFIIQVFCETRPCKACDFQGSEFMKPSLANNIIVSP